MESRPPSDDRDRADGRMLVLVPVRSASGLAAIPLASAHLTIGSAEDCDVRLCTPGVDKRHCLLLLTGNNQLLVKTFSPKTWVNDGAIREAHLVPGDRLAIGPLEYRLELSAPPSSAPPLATGPSAAESSPSSVGQQGPRRSGSDQPLCSDLGKPVPAPAATIAAAAASATALLSEHVAPADETARRQALLTESIADVQRLVDEFLDRHCEADASLKEQRAEITLARKELERQRQTLADQSAELNARAQEVSQAAAGPSGRFGLSQLEECRGQFEQELLSLRERMQAEQKRVDEYEHELAQRSSTLARQARNLRIRQKAVAAEGKTLQVRESELLKRQDDIQRRGDALARQLEQLAKRESVVAQERQELDALQRELAQAREALAVQRSEMTAQQEALEAYAGQLEARRVEIERREQALSVQEQELSKQRTDLDQRESEWVARAGRLETRENEVLQQTQLLERLQAALEQQQEELAQEKESLAVGQSLLERERSEVGELLQRRDEIVRSGEELSRREGSLAAAQQELQKRDQTLAAREAAVGEQARSLAAAQQAIDAQQLEIDQLQRELQQRAEALAERTQLYGSLNAALDAREQDVLRREQVLEQCARAFDGRQSSLTQDPGPEVDCVSGLVQADADVGSDAPSPEDSRKAATPSQEHPQESHRAEGNIACVLQSPSAAGTSGEEDDDPVDKLRLQLAELFGLPKPGLDFSFGAADAPTCSKRPHEVAGDPCELSTAGLCMAKQAEAQYGGEFSRSGPEEVVAVVTDLGEPDDAVSAYVANLLRPVHRDGPAGCETLAYASSLARETGPCVGMGGAVGRDDFSRAEERASASSGELATEALRGKPVLPDLNPFRELANFSARSAVARSNAVRKRSDLRIYAAIAFVSWVCALTMFGAESWMGIEEHVAGGVASIIAAWSTWMAGLMYLQMNRLKTKAKSRFSDVTQHGPPANGGAEEGVRERE